MPVSINYFLNLVVLLQELPDDKCERLVTDEKNDDRQSEIVCDFKQNGSKT